MMILSLGLRYDIISRFPGRLLSFRQHEQLLMAVDKLDYSDSLEPASESAVAGADGGAGALVLWFSL